MRDAPVPGRNRRRAACRRVLRGRFTATKTSIRDPMRVREMLEMKALLLLGSGRRGRHGAGTLSYHHQPSQLPEHPGPSSCGLDRKRTLAQMRGCPLGGSPSFHRNRKLGAAIANRNSSRLDPAPRLRGVLDGALASAAGLRLDRCGRGMQPQFLQKNAGGAGLG